MNVYYSIIIAAKSLKRHKLKAGITIMINTISIVLLLLSISMNLSIYGFIDQSLNNLNDESPIRVFILKYKNNDKISNEQQVIENVLRLPYIDNVTIISSNDSELIMKVIADDYRNIMTIVSQYATKEDYEVVLNESNLVNVEIIRVIKIISMIVLCIVIGLTYCTILFNTKNFISDMKYDIALLKALGYNNKHVIIVSLVESSITVFISFIYAIISSWIIIRLLINPILNTDNFVRQFLGKGIILNQKTLLITFGICFLLTSISTLNSLRKIREVSPLMLLNQCFNNWSIDKDK